MRSLIRCLHLSLIQSFKSLPLRVSHFYISLLSLTHGLILHPPLSYLPRTVLIPHCRSHPRHLFFLPFPTASIATLSDAIPLPLTEHLRLYRCTPFTASMFPANTPTLRIDSFLRSQLPFSFQPTHALRSLSLPPSTKLSPPATPPPDNNVRIVPANRCFRRFSHQIWGISVGGILRRERS